MQINADKPELYRQYIQREAERLVYVAARYGIVLTVEQVPRTPLAMGNHATVVSTRVAHK